MADKKIRAQLDELANVIEQIPTTSTQRHKLHELVEEIEKELDAPLPLSGKDTLAKRISENLSEFETDHPAAASVLNRIASTLTNIGI